MILSLFYFILPVLCFLANYIKETYNSKLLKIFLLVIIILFQCCGYMTGSDWRQYEEAYNSPNIDYYWWWEPSFRNLVYFSKHILNLDFWSFIIFIKIICFISVLFLFKTLTKQFWLVMTFFLLTNSNYLFIDNPLRNLIAYALFWSSILAFFYNRIILSFVLYVISILFHTSIILTVPLIILFLIHRRMSFNKSLCLYFLWFIVFNNYIIKNIALFLLKMMNTTKGVGYLSEASGGNMFGSNLSIKFILYLFIVFLIIKHKKILFINNSKNKDLISLSFLFILSCRLSSSIPILSRISNCFEPFFLISVANTIRVLNLKERHFWAFLIFLLLSFSTYRIISSTHVYVPYTNYFQFLILEDRKLDFNYRSRFNYINSPFIKKK